MRLFNCLPFFNELDLLEIRLIELYDVVDVFVIAEGTVTHSGNKKPLYFEENKERFERFLPKIRHIIVEDWPSPTPWGRERWQRRALIRGLDDIEDDDVVVVEDADEITRASVMKDLDPDPIIKLEHENFYFYLNSKRYARCDSVGTAFRWSKAKELSIPRPHWWVFGMEEPYPETVLDPFEIMIRHLQKPCRVPVAGWHFSYLGGPDRVILKINSQAHQELNTAGIKSRVKDSLDGLVDPYGRTEKSNKMRLVPIDDSFPRAVRENQDRYGHLIRKENT